MKNEVVQVTGYITNDLLPLAEAINYNADVLVEVCKELELLKAQLNKQNVCEDDIK